MHIIMGYAPINIDQDLTSQNYDSTIGGQDHSLSHATTFSLSPSMLINRPQVSCEQVGLSFIDNALLQKSMPSTILKGLISQNISDKIYFCNEFPMQLFVFICMFYLQFSIKL